MDNHKEEAEKFHKKLQEASNKIKTTMLENKDFQSRYIEYLRIVIAVDW